MMPAALLEAPQIPTAASTMARAGGENFPVALRVLSRQDRRHLLAVYGFARLADQVGDEIGGDRLAALDWLEQELDLAYAGRARHPLLWALQQMLAECPLPRAPFARLIEANRLDQRVSHYQTWEQLRSYCELSANPVGELVLQIFGLATSECVALSDRVCTALQLVEHLQDLGEDVARGRFYLPAEDLGRFDCSHEQVAMLVSRARRGLDLRGVPLASSTLGEDFERSAAGLREAVSFEVERAWGLLAAGVPLTRAVHGRPRLAVGAFVAGGRAALRQIERAGFDVLGGNAVSASRPRRLWALVGLLAECRG
jgi:squalene synthase HpnC